MAFNDLYRRQVVLLVRVLPFVTEEECFALKGGTAINLFIRDLPRLSVDIDLTYLPVKPRRESLADIDAAMNRIGDRLREQLHDVRAHAGRSREGVVTKLIVRAGDVQIKIEVTPVLRGCVFAPEMRAVAVQARPAASVERVHRPADRLVDHARADLEPARDVLHHVQLVVADDAVRRRDDRQVLDQLRAVQQRHCERIFDPAVEVA